MKISKIIALTLISTLSSNFAHAACSDVDNRLSQKDGARLYLEGLNECPTLIKESKHEGLFSKALERCYNETADTGRCQELTREILQNASKTLQEKTATRLMVIQNSQSAACLWSAWAKDNNSACGNKELSRSAIDAAGAPLNIPETKCGVELIKQCANPWKNDLIKIFGEDSSEGYYRQNLCGLFLKNSWAVGMQKATCKKFAQNSN